MRSHQKGFLKLKCLSPLKMLTSPLFEETFGAFLIFCFFSLPFSSAPSLKDLGVLMIFEEKIISLKLFFQLASIYWRSMHIAEWSYGDGRVVNILAVDAYSRIDVCTPIFMGEASS
jgi:hypothetical protein